MIIQVVFAAMPAWLAEDGIRLTPEIAVMRPAQSAVKDVVSFCESRDSWVVEGCYASLIEVALAWDPELWFLDPGVETCLSNCRSRPCEPHKYASKASYPLHGQRLRGVSPLLIPDSRQH